MNIPDELDAALTQAQGYSWSHAEGYLGPCHAFAPEDIVELYDVAVERGDYAETNVRATGKTRDGRCFFLAAGCDTTGWDCQSSCNVTFADNRTELWTWAMGDSDREALPLTINALAELKESTS